MPAHDVTTVAIDSDDDDLVRRLTTLLGDVAGLRLVRSDAGRRLTLVDERLPDAPATVRRLVDAGSTCLVLSDGADLDGLVEVLHAGATGCVARRTDPAAVRASIAAAAGGGFALPADVGRRLVARAAGADPAGPAPGGARERQLVQQVIAGRLFDIVFQPICDLRTGEIVALESLARFTSEPVRPPNVWLELAEAAGLRIALEHALLRAAVGLLGKVPRHISLSVNLSPAAAMDAGLAEVLKGVALHRLIVEISDHRQLDDYEPLSEALAAPRRDGLRIAVDDSGHGLSSLQQVAQLAPNFMKLNRTLTRNIDRDPTKHALAFALAAFAAQLGSAVVAEGLETEGELHALRALGAPLGQGYLLAHPRPLGDLALDGPLTLPAATGAVPPGPRLELTGVVRDDFREAVRVALRFLGRQHPTATFVVAHLDYVRRRHTVIGARGPLAPQLEPGTSTALDDTMCFHMAAGRGPRLCPDVGDDVVYGALGFARELEVGSYVGVPLELPDGTRIGSVFAIDRPPWSFEADSLPLVDATAAVLGAILLQQADGKDRGYLLRFLRQLARTDALTGVLNGPGFGEFLAEELERPAARRKGSYLSIEIEDLASLCQQYGRAVADLLLKDVANALTTSAEDIDVVGRLDENRFGVLLLGRAHAEALPEMLQGLESRLKDFVTRREIAMTVRAGAVPLADVTSPGAAWNRAAQAATRIV